jgi:hypothetical protein
MLFASLFGVGFFFLLQLKIYNCFHYNFFRIKNHINKDLLSSIVIPENLIGFKGFICLFAYIILVKENLQSRSDFIYLKQIRSEKDFSLLKKYREILTFSYFSSNILTTTQKSSLSETMTSISSKKSYFNPNPVSQILSPRTLSPIPFLNKSPGVVSNISPGPFFLILIYLLVFLFCFAYYLFVEEFHTP